MNLGRLFRYVRNRAKRAILRPKVEIVPYENVIRLGSNYGGWNLVDDPSLKGATIVSAGLGEDASFDVEFLNRYGAKVILIDPTPRSIEHFRKIQGSYGNPSVTKYNSTGVQAIESYDLSNANESNFKIVPKALWDRDGTVSFFSPPNPEHVSHSITNFQNSHSDSTPHITVECARLSSILRAEGIQVPKLLKLDIEGAEIEVLKTIVEDKILPDQLLIEYDELIIPEKISVDRVNSSISMLTSIGYTCAAFDGVSNFLFVR